MRRQSSDRDQAAFRRAGHCSACSRPRCRTYLAGTHALPKAVRAKLRASRAAPKAEDGRAGLGRSSAHIFILRESEYDGGPRRYNSGRDFSARRRKGALPTPDAARGSLQGVHRVDLVKLVKLVTVSKFEDVGGPVEELLVAADGISASARVASSLARVFSLDVSPPGSPHGGNGTSPAPSRLIHSAAEAANRGASGRV
jgi:hypothetical protein